MEVNTCAFLRNLLSYCLRANIILAASALSDTVNGLLASDLDKERSSASLGTTVDTGDTSWPVAPSVK